MFCILGSFESARKQQKSVLLICHWFLLVFVNMHVLDQNRYLERSGSCLGSSWDGLGGSWGSLAAIFGRSWAVLGLLGAILGGPKATLGRILGLSWVAHGWSWACLLYTSPSPRD